MLGKQISEWHNWTKPIYSIRNLLLASTTGSMLIFDEKLLLYVSPFYLHLAISSSIWFRIGTLCLRLRCTGSFLPLLLHSFLIPRSIYLLGPRVSMIHPSSDWTRIKPKWSMLLTVYIHSIQWFRHGSIFDNLIPHPSPCQSFLLYWP